MVEERAPRAPEQQDSGDRHVRSPARAPVRVEDLEATVEKLTQQVRWLSRHVVALEHDLAIYRIQERIPLGRRVQTAWESLVQGLRAFAEEWVDRREGDRL